MICETYLAFFKHLSDSTRLEIIKLLRKKPLSVSELVTITGFEQSRVSHTLKKLKEAGFVMVEPRGKERVYKLEKAILQLLKLTDKHVDTYYAHYCKCKGKTKKERWKNVTRKKI